MVICVSLKSVFDQTEGSRTFYVCEGMSLCVCMCVCAGTHEHRMGLPEWPQRRQVSSVEESGYF